MNSNQTDQSHNSGEVMFENAIEALLPNDLLKLMDRLIEERRPALSAAVESQLRASLSVTHQNCQLKEDKRFTKIPENGNGTSLEFGLRNINGVQSQSQQSDKLSLSEMPDDNSSCGSNTHDLVRLQDDRNNVLANKAATHSTLTDTSRCTPISQNSNSYSNGSSCQSALPSIEQSVTEPFGQVIVRDDLPTVGTSNTQKHAHGKCSSNCVRQSEAKESLVSVRTQNPLCVPLLLGWRREVINQTRSELIVNELSAQVQYVAPCGRLLSSTAEVDEYLYQTKSQLEIDVFSFDPSANLLQTYVIKRAFYFDNDISGGKEAVPISAVNTIQRQGPPSIDYVTRSVPSAEVLRPGGLSLDSNFLAGCDCVDNCRDSSKCACQQYTMSNATGVDGMRDASASYSYKRLYKCVNTGLFECNANCKCDRRCNNRVVQNGVRLRLQLFRTEQKGWGVRCLDDIAQGAFVCTYVGELLRDEAANDHGIDYGDEYLSNLDLIEIVEIARQQPKVGYQNQVSLAHRQLLEDLNTSSSSEDDDEDDEDEEDKDDPDWCASADTRRKRRSAKKAQTTERRRNFTRLIVAPDEQCDLAKLATTYFPPLHLDNSRVLPRIQRSELSARPGPSLRRQLFGEDEPFVMDCRQYGGIARFLNHSCAPNLFVQNVFIDTHDVRFPVIAFFAIRCIPAGTELCWDYNYALGQLPGREIYCFCGAENCRGRLL